MVIAEVIEGEILISPGSHTAFCRSFAWTSMNVIRRGAHAVYRGYTFFEKNLKLSKLPTPFVGTGSSLTSLDMPETFILPGASSCSKANK
jgi:hypothetical protein